MKKDPELTLLDSWNIIKSKQFVDLTHAFEPGIPHWPGYPDEKRDIFFWYDSSIPSKGTGFFSEVFTIVGQWGTHVDPPAHFHKGLRTADLIDVKEMLLPLVVIDIHEKAEKNHDYIVTVDDLKLWESKNGLIPESSFVALRTDWSKRWPDITKMENKDRSGISHYPAWGIDALKYLFEVRNITASGHETTDTDPGTSTSKGDYTCESYILGQDKYQIELLANLDKLPESGALIIACFPKPKGGSGFPARVFAIAP